MRANEFVPTSKPRNFVAKNAPLSGAGRHRDSSKKKDQEQGKVKHKKQAVPMESSLNELAGYGSDKKYKNLGSYKRYDVYVGKQKFNNLYYIAVAENPRTLDAKFKAKGNSAEEAVNKLKDEIDKEIDVAAKVSGQATLDFNVDFVKDILEMSSSVFYAKIVSGPKLVIAGPEMMEYPEIMRDEGFKASAIRTHKGGEGTTKLPGVPLSAKAASSANLIANGRYVLGSETIDKDGNRVFNLEFDSVVQASNDKMRLRAPAVTIGTNRSQGVAEGSGKPLSVQQLATISDAALDQAYGYGRSTPGSTFGWQANLMSATYAKKLIDAGVTDIEKISDAIHKGWNVTAQKFVQNPEQFDDTEKLRQAGKLDAKLQQRAKLMKINYAQLDNEEQEKDRVVARALLQAIKGQQGAAEGIGSKLAGLGLAGAMALGAGGAHARVSGDQDSNINRLTGKPNTTQVAPTDVKPAPEASKGFSKEYLQKAADPNRTGRYMISVEKAQELLKNMQESVAEATSVAVRMQRAADKQRAKSDASLVRTPSSIPKKEEPKKDQEKKNG